MRRNSAACPPQHAVEGGSSPDECSGCQGVYMVAMIPPVSTLLSSVERSQSARFLQVDRVSKRGPSENQIILLGFWKMVYPLLRQSPTIKIQKVLLTRIHLLLTPLVSRSLEGRTQFCLMQPSLYYTSCFLLL